MLCPFKQYLKPALPFFFITILVLIYPKFMIRIVDIPEDAGPFGDMYGALNTLFSGFAFAGVIVALIYQRAELKLQRKELRLQRKELEYQREELKLSRTELAGQKEQLAAQNETLNAQLSEATFFQLIRLHRELVDTFKRPSSIGAGADEFRALYMDFIKRSKNISKDTHNKPESSLDEIKKFYSNYWSADGKLLERYYKVTAVILEFIINPAIKNGSVYKKIVISQITLHEKLLLFYHCIAHEDSQHLKKLSCEIGIFSDSTVEREFLNSDHRRFLNE